MTKQVMRKGDVFYADLSPTVGSEQGGVRPVVVLQNDMGNYYSHTTIIAPFTSICKKDSLPTHVVTDADFLESESIVLLEQIRTVDKKRLTDYIGHLDKSVIDEIDKAFVISLGIRTQEII